MPRLALKWIGYWLESCRSSSWQTFAWLVLSIFTELASLLSFYRYTMLWRAVRSFSSLTMNGHLDATMAQRCRTQSPCHS